jgi:hypothetical protein
MPGALANTIFQGNSRDAMIVEDAYKISTNETRNSVFEASKGIYKDAVKGMYANKGSVRELASILRDAKNGNVDKVDMLGRTLGMFGSSLPSLLGTLGGTLKNKLEAVAGDFISDDAKKFISVIYNNASTLIGVADVNNAESLLEFVSELTGNSELAQFVNLEAESALIAGLANELMSFGIPELVDEAIQQARDERVRANAWAYISTTAVNGSDLQMVSKIIDEIGLTKFLENNPDAINSILSGFFFGTNDTVDKYEAKFVELTNLLVKINVNWNKYLRNGEYIPSLGPYIAASADAKTLFYLHEPHKTLTMTAKGKQPRSMTDVIKGMYPDAYIPT